jgi:type II secretory pathway pseudopilin PulG
MRTELVVAIVLVAVVVGALVLRWLVRRFRRMRRLERATAGVSRAMADGRLATTTGEALLQHLDGLRRTCSRGREG